MNLAERLKWRLGKYPTRLRCPFDNEWMCLVDDEHSPDCAHYNPETDECIHVEAARAQVDAARELSVIAQTLECETTSIRLRE